MGPQIVWDPAKAASNWGNINKQGAGNATSYSAAYSEATNQVSGGPGYDANGNQLNSTGLTQILWNANGQPRSVTALSGGAISGTYDALGRLVENGSGGGYTQFVFSPSGQKIAVVQGGTLIKGMVPLPGGATAIYSGATGMPYIRHLDWLGSARLSTTWAHTVQSKVAYAPFGETYNEAGASANDRSFTGQEQDTVSGNAATGIYDFLFRKYDPAAGRWLSPDPSGWGAASSAQPQSLDRYTYSLDNPLPFIDPFGLSVTYMGNGCYDDYNWYSTSAGGNTSIEFDDVTFCLPQNVGSNLPYQVQIPYTPLQNLDVPGSPIDPCANATLSAAGVTAQQQIATAQGFIAAQSVGANTTPYANPLFNFFGGMFGYFLAVHTNGPNDIKNQPGPGYHNQVGVDAGNVSFGITCPYGAGFCRFAAGLNQTWRGNPDFNGTLATGFDTVSDDSAIRIGQAMRAAGCHE